MTDIFNNLDHFWEHNLQIESRTIYLGSVSYDETNGDDFGINGETARQLIKNLIILNLLSNEPIHIILNSSGGHQEHGFAIYDAIKSSVAPVRITVMGQASSIASVILQAATERIMTPHSEMLIHYGNASLEVSSRGMTAAGDNEKRVNRKMEEIYMNRIKIKNPKYSIKLLREKLDSETILDAYDAVAMGLADKVMK